MGATLFVSIALVTLIGFLLITFNRLYLLRFMKRENRCEQLFERVQALFRIGILQKKMIQGEKKPGYMHAFIFWGFIIILFRKLQLFAIAFDEFFVYPDAISGIYTGVKETVSFMIIIAVFYALYRRIVQKPARLEKHSKEPLVILSMILMIMLTDFCYDGFKYALYSGSISDIAHEEHFAYISTHIADLLRSLGDASLTVGGHLNGFLGAGYYIFYWLQIVIVFSFLLVIPSSEHFHIVTALPAIFSKDLNRPYMATSAVPFLDLEALMDEEAEGDEEVSVGVNIVTDLSWKEGFDVLTCTECGRCKDSCPTWITEKPLAMMWVNQDIRNHMLENRKSINGSIEDTRLGKLVGNVIREDTLWACTTCGYCEAACPIELEHLPRIYKMRQNRVMMETEFPEAMINIFNNYENQSNPWGNSADTRGNWAKELNVAYVESADDMKNYEYLYYVGSAQSFDSRNQKVAQSMVKILRKANISFAILGKDEKSTGECIRRMGNEMLFQEMANELVETLNKRQVMKIITCDPHAFNTFKNEYKEFNGYYNVRHHTELISDLIKSGRLKVAKSFDRVIFHDPCYLGRHNGIIDQPRYIIDAISKGKALEFKMNKEKSMCCGAGGGRMWLEETIGSRINETRLEQAMDKKPKVIATGCPYCLIMMEEATGNKGLKGKVITKDIVELVADTLV